MSLVSAEPQADQELKHDELPQLRPVRTEGFRTRENEREDRDENGKIVKRRKRVGRRDSASGIDQCGAAERNGSEYRADDAADDHVRGCWHLLFPNVPVCCDLGSAGWARELPLEN